MRDTKTTPRWHRQIRALGACADALAWAATYDDGAAMWAAVPRPEWRSRLLRAVRHPAMASASAAYHAAVAPAWAAYNAAVASAQAAYDAALAAVPWAEIVARLDGEEAPRE